MIRLWRLLGKLILAALGMNLFIELASRKSLMGVASYAFGSPAVFLLNAVLLLTPFLLVFFTRRKVFWIAVILFLEAAAGAVNGVLLIFRTTPFTAADFRLAKYGARLLTTYLTWPQIILGALALAAAAAVCVILWRKTPVEEQPVSLTQSGCVSAAAMAVIWGSLNLAVFGGVVGLHFGNIGQAFSDYGFAYCFSNSVFNTGIEKPEDYESGAVAELEEKLKLTLQAPKPTGQEMMPAAPNVIMVQLESFFDPMLWENNPMEKDPIPLFRFLTRYFPSGYLGVPSVGAGTANTEFECITGMNLDFFGPGEYPYKTVLQKTVCESMAFDMKELGYKAHAIHNNEATFYDRHKVFSQLGFDTFTPIEYMYDVERNSTGWCRDEVLVGEIEKALDYSLSPDFVYGISVQGHGKYPSFEYYCEQLEEIDLFIGQLITMLSRRDEPTVLVLFGDHLPGFDWSEEEMENGSLFQTQYVVWNNLDLPPVKRDIEAYQLTSHVLNLLDIHEGTMIRFHQRHLDQGDTDSQAYLDAMKLLEYDILYGDQEVYEGKTPYRASRMEFGTRPIIQRATIHEEDQITVYGEGFNAWSRICVNGKPVETPYYQVGKLVAVGVPYEEGEGITVQQIGRDKIGLGTARKGPDARSGSEQRMGSVH